MFAFVRFFVFSFVLVKSAIFNVFQVYFYSLIFTGVALEVTLFELALKLKLCYEFVQHLVGQLINTNLL